MSDDGWTTTFYDFTDPDTGRRSGVVERRRVIATAPCIGCRLRQTNPDDAVTVTEEIWANGEREDDEVGCFCDRQEEGGVVPWRDNPLGMLDRSRVCRRCYGSGTIPSKTVKGRTYQCPACDGKGTA